MKSDGSAFEWPAEFDVPADVGAREINGWAWALRMSLHVLRQSAANGRAITLPNLLRFFDRRWSDYVTAAGDEPPYGRSRGRALLRIAYRNLESAHD